MFLMSTRRAVVRMGTSIDSTMAMAKQATNTMPTRFMKGSSGHQILSASDNTNEPMAATSAPSICL